MAAINGNQKERVMKQKNERWTLATSAILLVALGVWLYLAQPAAMN